MYVCTTGHASFTLLFLFVHSQKLSFLQKKTAQNCEVREEISRVDYPPCEYHI